MRGKSKKTRGAAKNANVTRDVGKKKNVEEKGDIKMNTKAVELEKMKVVELKEKLKEFGLSTAGLKKELIDRLRTAIEEKGECVEENHKSKEEIQHEKQGFEETKKEQDEFIDELRRTEEDYLAQGKKFLDNTLEALEEKKAELENQNSRKVNEDEGFVSVTKPSNDSKEFNVNNDILSSPDVVVFNRINSEDGFEKNTLFVTGLVRPFTISQLETCLRGFGPVTDFWLNFIRSKCFVKYSNIIDAMAAQNALNDRYWPAGSGNKLHVELISEIDALKQIEYESTSLLSPYKVGFQPHEIERSIVPGHSGTLKDIFKVTIAQPPICYTESQL